MVTRVPIWRKAQGARTLRRVVMAIEDAAKSLWTHSTTGWILLAAIIAACGIFWLHPQPVGYAVTVLGAAIGVMGFREMPYTQRVLMTIAILAFAVIELRNIHQDQISTEAREKQDRIAEDNRFATLLRTEAENFGKVLDKNQTAFDATMRRMEGLSRLSKENVDQVTGGDSYPYAVVFIDSLGLLSGRTGMPILQLFNTGSYSLYSMSVSVQDASGPQGVINMNAPQQSLGDLRPYDNRPINFTVRLPNANNEEVVYIVIFRARNGGWTEILHIYRYGTQLWECLEVESNKFPGKPSKVVKRMETQIRN